MLVLQKAGVRQRPLGIAALEDKIVRQVAVTILNRIYEVDFKGIPVSVHWRIRFSRSCANSMQKRKALRCCEISKATLAQLKSL